MKLRVTSRANRDLTNIADYLRPRNPQAAARVLDEIERTFAMLVRAPYVGRPSERPGLREFPLGNFPYLVVYRVTDAVEILAIFHTSRDPADKP